MKRRYYEGTVLLTADMSMEMFLDATGLSTIIKGISEELYDQLLLVEVKEEYNGGYFKDKPELKETLTEIFENEGLDKAISTLQSWVAQGLVNTRLEELREESAADRVLYNCSESYRVAYQRHRILRRRLKELQKSIIGEDDKKAVEKALNKMKQRVRKEESTKREKPLTTLTEDVIAVRRNDYNFDDAYKNMLTCSSLPEWCSGYALWNDGSTIKLTRVDLSGRNVTNRDFWWRLWLDRDQYRSISRYLAQSKEGYQPKSCVQPKPLVSLEKNRDMFRILKGSAIRVYNSRYGTSYNEDSEVPSSHGVYRHYYDELKRLGIEKISN